MNIVDNKLLMIDKYEGKQITMIDLINTNKIERIANIGEGPNEFLNLRDITYNSKNNSFMGHRTKRFFSMVGKNGRKVLKTKGFRHDRENGLNISKRFFSLHGLISALRLRGFSSDIRGIALHRACRWG